MECINRNKTLKPYSLSPLPINYSYSKKDKLDILKNGHDTSYENLDIIFSNNDLDYTYSDIFNFIISNNLHFTLNLNNSKHKNIIKNILWNISNTSMFYNKNNYRSDPNGCLIKYDEFISCNDNLIYPNKITNMWTIINIFPKELFIQYFGEKNLIYFNSLINLQAVHIQYKKYFDDHKEDILLKKATNIKNGKIYFIKYLKDTILFE